MLDNIYIYIYIYIYLFIYLFILFAVIEDGCFVEDHFYDRHDLPDPKLDPSDLKGNHVCSNQPKSWIGQSPEECQRLCKNTTGCEKFTWIVEEWVEAVGRCCLKDNRTGHLAPRSGRISGPIDCGKHNSVVMVLLGFFDLPKNVLV